ncbi:hypothetical protein ABBQ38_011969 [Trebouxia sp. C0009 RCD-2024]
MSQPGAKESHVLEWDTSTNIPVSSSTSIIAWNQYHTVTALDSPPASANIDGDPTLTGLPSRPNAAETEAKRAEEIPIGFNPTGIPASIAPAAPQAMPPFTLTAYG